MSFEPQLQGPKNENVCKNYVVLERETFSKIEPQRP